MFELPEFPTQYTEEDQARSEELKKLSERQKQLWQSDFRPDVYETKPLWEKALRDRASSAREMSFPPGFGYAVSELQERIPFYNERTFDYVSRETEAEFQELKRKQEVANEMPPKLELIAFAYAQGLPIVDETFLFKMFPELNPRDSSPERLNLNEEERGWFDDWLGDLKKVPKDQLADFFVGRPLSPETMEDVRERLAMVAPQATPTQIMSSVAFSQSNDDIRLALRYAQPAQVSDDQAAFEQTQKDKITAEMEALGLTITDDWEQNLLALQEKRLALKKTQGIPFVYTDPETDEKFDVFLVEDSQVFVETSAGRELVGYYDKERGVYIPLTPGEELENLDQIPFTDVLEDGTEVQLIYKVSDGTIWLDHYEHWYERLVQHSLKIGEYNEEGEFVSREPLITETLVEGIFKGLDTICIPFRLSGTGLWLMGKGFKVPDELEEEFSSYSQEEQDYLTELDKGVREILATHDVKLPDNMVIDYGVFEKAEEMLDLYEDEFEELDKLLREKYGLPAEGIPISYPSWWEKPLIAASYFQENVPWWQQLLYELPAFIVAGKVGLTATGGRILLGRFIGRGGIIGASARTGRIALAPLAGYEWVIGKTFHFTFGQFPKLAANVSGKVARRSFERSPGGIRLAEIFGKKSPQYKDFFNMWKLYSRKPPKGQPATFYEEVAMKEFNYLYSSDEMFRKGFNQFMKWSATHQTGATSADAAYTYALTRTSAASAGAPADSAQVIGNLFKDITEKNIPVTAVTTELVAKAVPEGVVLSKPPSLIEELKELGYTVQAINAMKPEEAWADAIAGRVPAVEKPIVLPAASEVAPVTEVPGAVKPTAVAAEVTPVVPEVITPQPVVDIAQRDWFQGQIETLSAQLKELTVLRKALKAKEAKTISPDMLETKQGALVELEKEIKVFQDSLAIQETRIAELPSLVGQEAHVEAKANLESELKLLLNKRLKLNKEIAAIQEQKPPAEYIKPLREINAQMDTVKAQLKNYEQQLKKMAAPAPPNKPLAPTKETRAEWNSKTDKKEKLQKAGNEKAAEIAEKDFRLLNPTEQAQAMAAMPELKPSLEEAAKLWNEAPASVQTEIATQAGLSKKFVGKKFEELTDAQQKKIQDVIGRKPKKPLIDKDKVESLSYTELQAGGARDVEASVEAATGAVGSSTRIISAESVQKLSPEELDELIRGHYSVIADKDNLLDVAFVSIFKKGNLADYFKVLQQLPHREDGTIDFDTFVTQAFKDQDIVDASMPQLNSMPTRDAFNYLDGGEPGELSQKVFEVNEHVYAARMFLTSKKDQELHEALIELGIKIPSYWNLKAMKKFNETTFALAQSIGDSELFKPAEELLQKPETTELLKHLSAKEALTYIEFAKTMRLAFHNVFNEANTARELQGRDPIEFKENYLTHAWEVTAWGKMMGRHLKPEWLKKSTFAPDFVKNNTEVPFNPRDQVRKDIIPDEDLTKDLIKLYREYVSVMTKDNLFPLAIGNARAYVRVLEERGYRTAARYFQNHVIGLGLLNMPEVATVAVREVMPSSLYNYLQWQNKRLTIAVFGANLPFVAVVQASSLALVPMVTGLKNFLGGVYDFFFNSELRDWVETDVASHVQKQRGVAGIKFADLQTPLHEFRSRFHLSPLETLEDWVMLPVRAMENMTNKMAALSGRRWAISKGHADKSYEMNRDASSTLAKTQSMYDPPHQAGIYADVIRMFLRFQTFNIDAVSRLRELLALPLPGAKAGAWKEVARAKAGAKPSRRIRLTHLIGALSVMSLFNLWGDWLSGRKPWEYKSWAPFLGIYMLPLDINNPWYLPVPMRWAYDFKRGVEGIIEHDNWDRFRAWALRWYFPAGVQADKMIDAFIAIAKGGVYEVSDEDKLMFELNEEEWWKAITFGVWSTDSAREWRRRKIEGYPESTQQLLTDLEANEEKLKAEMGYTLRDYRTEALGKLKSEGIPAWQFDMPDREGITPDLWEMIEDNPFYPPLTIYAALSEYQFSGYYEISYPEDPGRTQRERREFRREYPVVDAGLVFWEIVKRPLSSEAEKILYELFDGFDISEPEGQELQHFEHWSKLPEPPSWAELLPD